MTIVTLLYLSGAVTGTVIGEAYKPLSLPFHDKDCYTHTKTIKEYNFEIKDYIENSVTEETCIWKPQNKR